MRRKKIRVMVKFVLELPETEDPFETERDTLRAKLTWTPTDSSEVTYTHAVEYQVHLHSRIQHY